MLRLSKLTDYGTVLLAYLAQTPDSVHTAADVAEHTHLALPTVSKLLKLLARGGLVISYRGAHGGYTLARPADEITAVQIIDAIEGTFGITECSTEERQCNLEAVCAIGQNWQGINGYIREMLRSVTLEHLGGPAGASCAGISTVPVRSIARSASGVN
jgi:FeS assembly SUF system regulator